MSYSAESDPQPANRLAEDHPGPGLPRTINASRLVIFAAGVLQPIGHEQLYVLVEALRLRRHPRT
jgi:hypothetical protein